jgi:hypothetical protein
MRCFRLDTRFEYDLLQLDHGVCEAEAAEPVEGAGVGFYGS